MNTLLVLILVLILVSLLGGAGLGFHSTYPQAFWGGGTVGLVLLIIVIVVLLRGI